jgi:hypothetical protein
VSQKTTPPASKLTTEWLINPVVESKLWIRRVFLKSAGMGGLGFDHIRQSQTLRQVCQLHRMVFLERWEYVPQDDRKLLIPFYGLMMNCDDSTDHQPFNKMYMR